MEKTWKKYSYIPVALAVAFVPLITVLKRYSPGLEHYAWFSNSLQTAADVFLYYKSYWMMLLAVVMVLMIGASFTFKKMPELDWKRFRSPELICLLLYMVLSFVSALFSKFRETAFWGGYEQWEGEFVILAYLVLFAYTYLVADGEVIIRYLTYALIAGSLIVGGIGAFQYLHMDFFKTKPGSMIMSLMLEKTTNFSFNFPDGQSYSTLYNPNYIGSYAVLLLPVLLAVVLVRWGEIHPGWHVAAMLSFCLNFVSLVGSRSLTGMVGIVVCMIFSLVYFLPVLIKRLGAKTMIAGAGVVILLLLTSVFVFSSQWKEATDKLFHPNKDSHTIASMVSSKDGVKITTVTNRIINLKINDKSSAGYEVTDEKGSILALEKNTKDGGMMVKDDEKLSDIRFYLVSLPYKKDAIPAVIVQTRRNYKSWYICQVNGTYQLCNGVRKLDDLVEIKAVGFEKNQHFGDKRGYIWSRTIPLLKDYIWIGSGPNTFTEVYPNNDYVGLNNLNYYGSTITKPHNMYLQTWVQTGALSLLAFVIFVGWYIIKSIKLYYRRESAGLTETMGKAILIAVIGYMVTGLANDSTVTVAPVFWGMLGLGMAINKWVQRNDGK